MLALDSYEGILVDPHRRAAAESERPGTWQLVSTTNGVSLQGLLVREGRSVLQLITRSAPVGDWLFPEVQATYIFEPSASLLADELAEALGVRPLSSSDFGELDDHGHATMGPVPIPTTWRSVGEPDAPPPFGDVAEPSALVWIGGGVITLANVPGCCRFLLAPLPTAPFTVGAAEDLLRSWLDGTPARISTDGARVWNRPIRTPGCSYETERFPGSARLVGAVWADQFGQAWQLRYTLCAEHSALVETALTSAR